MKRAGSSGFRSGLLCRTSGCASFKVPWAQIALSASPATAQPGSGSRQAITLRTYTFLQSGGDVMIGLAVTSKTSGSCFAASPTRPHAYRRRNEGHAIRDPCFAPLDDRVPLDCSCDSWSATLLTRSGPLPTGTTPSAHAPNYDVALPWALEPANGQRGTAITGQRRRSLDCRSTPAVRTVGWRAPSTAPCHSGRRSTGQHTKVCPSRG